MEFRHPEYQSPADADGHWFLKVDENQIRGPVPFDTLREWAEAGSLKADEEISRDGRTWQTAASLPTLELEWIANIGGGEQYGPFNLLAAPQLVARGILKPDSVLRREVAAAPQQVPPVAPAAARRPRTAPPPRYPGSRAALSDGTRMSQLESELSGLHAELTELQQQRLQADRQAPDARALTATAPRRDDLTERIDQIYEKAHRAETMLQHLAQKEASRDDASLPALTAERTSEPERQDPLLIPASRITTLANRRRPMPILYADEGNAQEEYEMSRPERVRELARTRRFRVQTLRWNVINSSLVIGTGSTVGAISYMLVGEAHPVTWTGLILAGIGCVHFLFTMLIWMGSRLINWTNVSVVSDTEAMTSGRPVHGMLNVTVFWFKRRFGSRPNS